MSAALVVCRVPLVVDERFVRASGPGGQNVNKVATAVELRFDVERSPLPPEVKRRLVAIAGRRVGADGVLVVDSRAHRTQMRNREAARERLAALVERAWPAPTPRRATRPKRAAAERRIAVKKRRGDVKQGRRRAGDE